MSKAILFSDVITPTARPTDYTLRFKAKSKLFYFFTQFRQKCNSNAQKLTFSVKNFAGDIYCPDNMVNFCNYKQGICKNFCSGKGICASNNG